MTSKLNNDKMPISPEINGICAVPAKAAFLELEYRRRKTQLNRRNVMISKGKKAASGNDKGDSQSPGK